MQAFGLICQNWNNGRYKLLCLLRLAGTRKRTIHFLRRIFGKKKKAAPRFELGIKDLQSSALPLGHAAALDLNPRLADRIRHSTEKVLFLSNGHGEDLIALQVLQALHRLRPSIACEIFPLVGEGKVFTSAISEGWLRKVGPSLRLPSGGFSNQSLKGFFQDILAGLLVVTWKQWRFMRRQVQAGSLVVAVGDLLPLIFSWLSGAPFVFIGTPKSDYTWRTGPNSAFSDYYHCLKGTEWDPWEYFLMRSNRCKLVAVRDQLTARGLRKHGVLAKFPGNPMMDGFPKCSLPIVLEPYRRLILLCGSRSPEAEENFQRLLLAAGLIQDQKPPLAIFVALGSEPSVEQIEFFLDDAGYRRISSLMFQGIGAQACWKKGDCSVLIGKGKFSLWSSWAEVGLATAGTATEQLVGLGVPALSLPGNGPQFKKSFAFRQSRLLGGAVLPCKSPSILAQHVKELLYDERQRRKLGLVGSKRMGSDGGSNALASLILKLLLVQEQHIGL